MILQLRIDERLIHGQIAAAWGRALPLSAIVCASDVAVKDPIRSKMLLMAAPPGLKTRIKSVDDTIKLLSDARAKEMKVLLITDSPVSAKRLCDGLDIPEINVANYHSPKNESDKQVHIFETCKVNEEDFKAFEELLATGKDIYSQMIPSGEKRNFSSLLKSVKK